MQLAKHKAGKYEWVVSLPARDIPTEEVTTRERSSTLGSSASNNSARKVHFGCTMVRADGQSELVRRNRSNSGNTFTLIATPIDSDDKASTERIELMGGNFVKTANPEIAKADEVKSLHGVMEEAKSLNDSMIAHGSDETVTQDIDGLDGAIESGSLEVPAGSAHADLTGSVDVPANCPSPVTLNNINDTQENKAFDETLCFPPQPSSPFVDDGEENINVTLSMQTSPVSSFVVSPSSRIEDSIEALDQFEEQFEAISAATQLDHVLSSQRTSKPMSSLVVAEKTPTRRSQLPMTKPLAATRRSPSYATRTSTAPKRLSISKPSSLQPPKPLTRTAKPPTVATFELPGDAVARQLKARREARLSTSNANPSQMPRGLSSSPTKTSVVGKPPTRPNFELPGEAISRRKREEREAKLKAQEEEERKRREFKARPMRTSISSGSLSYRETAASRARQNVIKTATEKPTPNTSKRRSIAATFNGRPSISRPALNLGTGPSSPSKASTVRSSRRPNALSTEKANRDDVKSPGSDPSPSGQDRRLRAKISSRDCWRNIDPSYPATDPCNLRNLILAINPSEEELAENRREAEELARKRDEEWPQTFAKGLSHAEKADRQWKEQQEKMRSGLVTNRCGSPDDGWY